MCFAAQNGLKRYQLSCSDSDLDLDLKLVLLYENRICLYMRNILFLEYMHIMRGAASREREPRAGGARWRAERASELASSKAGIS